MYSERQVRRLVLIDEDPILAQLVRELLESHRRVLYRVAHFTHLVDALTYFKINPVDIVLVGPSPQDGDTESVVRKLTAAHPGVPLVALVGGSDRRFEDRIQAAGAKECLRVEEVNSELWTRTLDFCHREMVLTQELACQGTKLEALMHTDSLTGLLNRKGMERTILGELAHCRQVGRDLVILLVDLDDFSRINATLGHGVGDLVLVAAARRINESIREQDRAGRCGTDRFVVLLPEADLAQGEVIAEKIRLAISCDVIQAGDHTLATTASLGLAAINPSSISFDEVLAQAHFILQRCKLQGKNRVGRSATVEEVGVNAKPDVEPEVLRKLLRGQGLEIVSQPIVNLADGRIVSREMLVRGPEGPLHQPDNLFRFCQEKNILTAVDLLCLKKCAGAAAHLVGGPRYHVNIMPATLLQTPAEELIRVLHFNDNYGHCCLEISEQQLLGDPSVLVSRVKSLQEAGIRIAIDDVGFGNSCLEGLIMLQPQVMKIDKRLVRGLASDDSLRQALTRLLKVAQVLGAEVIAEGIENSDDYRVLMKLGVRYGQGYLFGRPQRCRTGSDRPVLPTKSSPPPDEQARA